MQQDSGLSSCSWPVSFSEKRDVLGTSFGLFNLTQVEFFITKIAGLEWVTDSRSRASKRKVKERMSYPVARLLSIHLTHWVTGFQALCEALMVQAEQDRYGACSHKP